MTNRHQRRAEKTRQRSQGRMTGVESGKIDSMFDVQVEGKFERAVFICASPRGRKIVEDVWPDVEWTTDEEFSKLHSADWLFTYIRVTRLPTAER